jgi:hypothetical protein
MKTVYAFYEVEKQVPTLERTSEELRSSENFILSWDLNERKNGRGKF